MLPIIEDCAAVVMCGEAKGREVKVLRFVGCRPFRSPTDYWELEPLSDLEEDGCVPYASERNLLRIDGGELIEINELMEITHD